jgi:alpha-amylase
VAFTTPISESTLSIPTRETDGHILPVRQEIRVEISGGDVNEVTFALARASRPGQYELLGVDDAPPYRVFWRPPADLAPDDSLSFIATVSNLRGATSSARVNGIKIAAQSGSFGIRGSTVPKFRHPLLGPVALQKGAPLTLAADADGTGPLHYIWLKNGEEIPNAANATLLLPNPSPGNYRVMVRGLAGTVLSEEIPVTIR